MSQETSHPFDMIVVGATGDLSRRKLLPALFFLHTRDALPEDGRILLAVRPPKDAEKFLDSMRASTEEHLEEAEFTQEAWECFAKRLEVVTVDITDGSSYANLKSTLEGRDDTARIFYLATPPRLYTRISHTLAEEGLVTPKAQIVLEKPIGKNLQSAQAINEGVGEVFAEDRIYRIDHYLGKETVQNLMVLRFGNALFEPLWCSDRIDHVQITVAEQIGVEGRGDYYDHAGALRDMVQNHLLQLLCLVAMEPPSRLDQDAIRGEKIKVLRALRRIEGEDVFTKTVRGQYRAGAAGGNPVISYTDEEGISSDSKTETFVAIKAEIDNWRWAGVPFYLRTGKRMMHRLSEIVIQFKKVPHHLFEGGFGAIHDNRLVIRVQPDENIRLGLMIKKPGTGMKLRPEHLNLNMAAGRKARAYERLLMDVIRGNPTLFIHREEVEEAWRWVEPIHDAWEERDTRPRSYVAGTWGPPDAVALTVQDDRNWYENLV